MPSFSSNYLLNSSFETINCCTQFLLYSILAKALTKHTFKDSAVVCGERQTSVSNMGQTLKSIGLRSGDEGGHNSLLQNRKTFFTPSLDFTGGVRGITILLIMVKSSFLKCFLSYLARLGPKYHWCAHLCWLCHSVSQKSEIYNCLTLQPKPWQTLASGGDKQLTCLQERPLSVKSALCRFVNWTIPPKWIFLMWKTISPFCVPYFSKFQRPYLSALFRCWSIVSWRIKKNRSKVWPKDPVHKKTFRLSSCTPNTFTIHYELTQLLS